MLQAGKFSDGTSVLIFFGMPGPAYYMRMASPVGPLLLASSERGLFLLQFGHSLPARAAREEWIESPARLQICAEELQGYFAGRLRDFRCAIDPIGTPFQKRCWEALRDIPYGETRTYAEIARQIGSPRAFRAVGQANHENPIAIIVPCHRVVGADGTLTGYGGGLEIKQKLLQLEGAKLARPLNLNLEFAAQL